VIICSITGNDSVVRIARADGETAMKIVVSALVALSVLAGIAGPAGAVDAKTFYEQQDRDRH
jgi:hypothetical protein